MEKLLTNWIIKIDENNKIIRKKTICETKEKTNQLHKLLVNLFFHLYPYTCMKTIFQAESQI